MNILDTRTVLFSSVITSAICALVMASLWRQNRRRSPELGYWLADFVLQFLSMLLIALRGVLPDVVSVLFGVPFILTGALLLFIGLERYVGKTSAQRYNFGLLAGFVLVHAYFIFGQPSLPARNINLSLGLLVICGQCAWLMLRRVEVSVRPETKAVGLVFGVYSLVSVLRIFVDTAAPHNNDLFTSGLYDTLAILIYQLLLIGLTFALFLMVNRRLVTALENDITERRQAEEALRQGEQRFRLLFQNLTSGFALHEIILDAQDQPCDYRFLEVNPAFEALTGLKASNIIGKTVRQVLPDTEAIWIEHYGQVALTGAPIHFESFSRALGKHYEVSAYSPNPGQFAVLFMDVTERKQIEETLHEREDKFRYVFDHSVVGKSITLPTGEIQVNQAFCEMLGYSTEELQNKRWQEITQPDDIDLTQREINALLAGDKEAARFIKRYLHKNGSVVWADANTSLRRDKAGNPLYFMTAVIDITQRKQMELEFARLARQMELILESAGESIYGEDLAGKITFVNPALSRMLGWEPAELLGKPGHSVYHHSRPDGSAYPIDECKINLALRDGKVHRTADEVFWRKDGTSFAADTPARLCVKAGRSSVSLWW